MNNQIKWLEQINKVHAGQVAACPQCGSINTVSTFYRFPDGVGYGDMICKNCGDKAHISRMKFPENSKAKITEIE